MLGLAVITPETAFMVHARPLPAGAGERPPRLRPSTVPRARLVRPLVACRDRPVAIITAPAGYGKTTLLAQWALRDQRPFTWVAGGDAAAAMHAIETAVNTPAPRVIVLDEADRIRSADLRRILDGARELPTGAVLALGSRACLDEPTGRLRAHGLLLELGPEELSLTHLEAARMVASAGLALSDDQLTRLLARTEGWPAALSLAATALEDADDVDRAIAAFDGDDRIVADYLQCDLLARLTWSERALLRRCSVLSRLSGPACDAVLGVHGSGATLRSLMRMGLPLTPLDRCDRAFRQHPLLASMLRAELTRAEPELAPALHRRAALFYAEAGEPDAAIQHAIACRDTEIAGRMLWSIAPEILAEGRGAGLGSALGQLRESEVASHPGLAL
ncbi:MAG TPA: hypothetical protein VI300_14200, partial [Solirubrobacter sp.]